MSSAEMDDDAVKSYARKRQRRNAIKPNSMESIALRDFSLLAQMDNVTFGSTEDTSSGSILESAVSASEDESTIREVTSSIEAQPQQEERPESRSSTVFSFETQHGSSISNSSNIDPLTVTPSDDILESPVTTISTTEVIADDINVVELSD